MNEAAVVTFTAASLMGLGFGAGPCSVACLPFLGPVFLGSPTGIRHSWRLLLPFSLGRVTGYSLLGILAGLLGAGITSKLDSSASHMIQGGAILLVAFGLFWRRQRNSSCGHHGDRSRIEIESIVGQKKPEQAALPTGLFFMGAGMALNPCIPLSTLLLAAAATGNGIAGGMLGLGFGLGAALVPALLFGIGFAHFSSEIRQHLGKWLPRVEQGGIALLLVLGIGTITGWINL